MARRGVHPVTGGIVLSAVLASGCGGGPATGADVGTKPLRDAVSAGQRVKSFAGTYERTFASVTETGNFAIQETPLAAVIKENLTTFVAAGGVGYMQFIGETKWTKVALDPASEPVTHAPDQVSAAIGQVDPLANTRFIRAALGDFERVGSDRVLGISTSHFSGTFKDDSGLTDIGVVDPRLTEISLKRTRFELWIDRQHRVRKFAIESADGNETVTVDSYDLPVRVQVPSPDEVTVESRQRWRRIGRGTMGR